MGIRKKIRNKDKLNNGKPENKNRTDVDRKGEPAQAGQLVRGPQKQGLEREIKEIDKQIREARKMAALAQSLQDKLAEQKTIKALEKTRNTKRRELFDAQDAINAQREELIENIEKQLKQRRSVQTLFCIR